MDTRVRRLDDEIKELGKQKDDIVARMEELEKTDNGQLIPIVAVIIALIGGIPGIFTVINHYYKRPKFSYYLVSGIFGNMVGDKNKKYTLILLTGTVSNKGSEPLTPDHFELRAKIDGSGVNF